VLAAINETGPNIGLMLIMVLAVALPLVAIIDALSAGLGFLRGRI
jgi:hypothetical protein